MKKVCWAYLFWYLLSAIAICYLLSGIWYLAYWHCVKYPNMKELLYRIIPTSIYKELSKSYYFLLDTLYNTDPDLIKAIRNGFVLTVLIITTFAFFPGEPMDFSSSSSFNQENQKGKEYDNDLSVTNILGSRMIFRLVMWVILIIGGIIILEKSYGLDLGYILSLYFPKETIVFRRIFT